MKIFQILFVFIGSCLAISFLMAQRPGGPGSRKHTANKAQPLELVPATEQPPARNKVKIGERRDRITIVSNGIPKHKVGEFPNRSNPNTISEQSRDVVIPDDPKPADRITYIHKGGRHAPRVFGITLDGVLIEPGTAEVWMGNRASGWNYEALGGAVPLGLDANYGHVQPTGLYHYHGIPTGLLKRLGAEKGQHSPMIGWAADGFPIYAVYGYADPQDPKSAIVELKTSYRLRDGERPPQPDAPGGNYDGSFVQDYEFEAGVGTLDECNGRFCVTPEFPEGTYAYFMTQEWPVIPRAFRGTPVQLKEMGPPPFGGRRPPRHDSRKGPRKNGPPPPPF